MGWKIHGIFFNKNFVFINSMHFMNCSLDNLVKNMSDKDSELLKKKDAYPYEYMNSFERFNEEKLPARKYFFSSIKKKKNW